MKIYPKYDGDLNGIISLEMVKYEVIGSSKTLEHENISNIFDRKINTWWMSNIEPSSFVQINFINSYILLTNYTIQVGTYYNKPKQWVVDGFDGKSWHNISTVT